MYQLASPVTEWGAMFPIDSINSNHEIIVVKEGNLFDDHNANIDALNQPGISYEFLDK